MIQYATDATEISDWITARAGRIMALDTETTGLDYWAEGFRVGVLCVATSDEALVVPGERDVMRHALRTTFKHAASVWAHNADFDAKVLRATSGMKLSSLQCSITMARTLKWGVDASGISKGFGLKFLKPTTQDAQDALRAVHLDLVEQQEQAPEDASKDEQKEAKKRIRERTGARTWLPDAVASLPPETPEMVAYVAEDTVMTAELVEEMQAYLDENPRHRPAVELDLQTDAVWRWVGYDGLAIDRPQLLAVLEALESKLAEEEQHFGFRPWTNNNARRDWVNRIGVSGLERTSAGAISLGKKSRPQAQVPEDVRPEWDRFERCINAASVLSKLHEFERLSKHDSRIHPTFNANRARTGRMSASSPAVQNISRPTEDADLRDLLIADPGRVLVAADLSHVEPSVMAALSGDPLMLQHCARGMDPYVELGRITHGEDAAERDADGNLTPEAKKLRSQSKVVLLALMYGMGNGSLGRSLGLRPSEAADVKNRVRQGYQTLARWLDSVHQNASKMLPGFTPWGGKLPAVKDKAYVAQNHLIQGTAACIFKHMVLNVARRLPAEAPGARLWLAVHDELEIETPAEHAEAVAQILREEMHVWLTADGVNDHGEGVEIWGDPEIIGPRWKKLD